MTRRPPPRPFDDEDSRIEKLHRGQDPKVQQAVGRIEDEGSVSLSAPSPIKKGSRVVPRAAVGLRAASERGAASAKASETKSAVVGKVRAQRDERRQRVWEKLDAARRAADERLPRYDTFQPKRPGDED